MQDRLIHWLFVISAIMILLVLAIGMLEADSNPGFDSIVDIAYWAVVTLATVGTETFLLRVGPRVRSLFRSSSSCRAHELHDRDHRLDSHRI